MFKPLRIGILIWMILGGASVLGADLGADLGAEKTPLWVYTSIYKEFAAPLKAAFEKKHPDADIQIFQGGSEKIQAKVEAELVAHRPQADILMTSDPFWSTDLEKRGLVYPSPRHSAIETNYYSVMVLITHRDVPPANRPSAFTDLARPGFDNQVQMGSPLESGTTFTLVALLSRKYGWNYFSQLRKNRIASSGGNSTVIQKVESGEKKIGIVLLENALAARKRGSPVEIIYPKDGAVLIPSVQVILKDSPHKKLATQFSEFVLSAEGQKLLRDGFMYSVNPNSEAPEGAPSFKLISERSTPWTPDLMRGIAAEAKAIKKKFSELVLD